MSKKFLFVSVLVVLGLFLAACSPAAPTADDMMEKPTEAMAEKPTEIIMEKTAEPTHAAMEGEGEATPEGGEDAMMEAPAWFSVPLTNAATGETFTIADYKGQVVLVETLAMWCSNCLQQQKQVAALHGQIGDSPDFVSIGIDIDTNENIEDLKGYTASNGFDWIYTVASPDVAREIGNLYGNQFLNPPSTPMLIIDRHGEVHTLPFGIKSADDLQVALQPFLDGGM
ncbi:MAG: TlpA family protein disulfide reductase [Anaerolineae bacterium]|nr:TlpA family protein disulfide reductase [Anaerolineae bacterium]